MAVGVQAQVVLNVLRQLAPLHFIQVLKQRLATPDHHIERAQKQQLLPGVGNAHRHQHVARQKALFALDHHVHRSANQHLGQDVKKLVEDRVKGGEAEVAAVAVGVLEEALDGVHRAIVTARPRALGLVPAHRSVESFAPIRQRDGCY